MPNYVTMYCRIKLLFFIFCGYYFFCSLVYADDKIICAEDTQVNMNSCMVSEYAKSDKELNNLYSELINVLLEPDGIRKSQRAWLKYRDAECSNDVFQLGEGGSLIPYVHFSCMNKLTIERIERLKEHLASDCNGCPPRK